MTRLSQVIAVALWVWIGASGVASAEDWKKRLGLEVGEPEWYAGLGVGASIPGEIKVTQALGSRAKVDMSTGYVVQGSAGFDMGGLRGAFEIGWRSSDVDSVSGMNSNISAGDSVGVLTLMGELAVDFIVVPEWLEAYAAIGLGAANMHADFGDEWDFSYAPGAGLYIPVLEPVGFDIGYRYRGLGRGFEVGLGNDVRYDWHAHEVTFGIRYLFGGKQESGADR